MNDFTTEKKRKQPDETEDLSLQTPARQTAQGRTAAGSAARYSASGQGAYAGPWRERLTGLTEQHLSRAPFSYDPEKDPLYKQYEQSYTRGARRAMQDTLGQLSARTGGLASSYAAGASQAAYDNQMAQLADKVPALWELAYEKYRGDEKSGRDDISLLSALDGADYDRWSADRSFAYSASRDELDDARRERQYADSRADADYSRALDKARTLAAAGDFSGYAALGYTGGELARLQAALDTSAQKGGGKGSSGGSAGKSGSASGKGGASGQSGGLSASERLARDAMAWAGQQRQLGHAGADAADYIIQHYKDAAYQGATQKAANSYLKTWRDTDAGYTDYAWQRAGADQTKVPETVELGENAFAGVLRKVQTNLAQGTAAGARDAVSTFETWRAKMSPAQQGKVKSLLRQYGVQ